MPAEPERRPAADRTEIVLQNPCGYPEAGARRHRAWLEDLVAELAPEAGSLGVRFVSDREMRRLNRDFRGKDRPTDVLSFPGDDEEPSPDGASNPLGDVVVSVPTARRQAGKAGHDPERELRILLLHGILHCLGYDHETDDGEMERTERKLRRRWIP